MSVDRLIERGIVQVDVPLGPLTTYKAGGPARLFAEMTRSEDLSELVSSGLCSTQEVLVLGRGSNLVVADSGFPGLVVKLGGEFALTEVGEDQVCAGAAVPLPRLAREIVDAGLVGLEFFVGIPGSVGGAIRQNAGCFGVEARDRLVNARVIDLTTGEETVRGPSDLDMSYRHSNLRATEVVIGAGFVVERGDPGPAREEMRRITRWRRDHQPGGTLNAGSVFKNPPGMAAGELIDRLGLKGTRVGEVAVSHKHANFFVAGPSATAAQIRELVEVVKDLVFERSGTKLETEIQFVGFDQ